MKNFHDPKNPKESKILNKFDLIIADECFTYETMVMTDIGEIKIGDIVENSLDVNVLTYNHQTKKTEYKKIFRWLKKNKDTIYQIKLQNGVFIECTGNHKFYTKNKGYVRADELTTKDDLYELSKGINQKTNLEKKSNLFSILRNKLQIQNKSANKKNKKIQVFQKLSELWKNNVILYRKRNEQPKKLFNKMYDSVKSEKSGNTEKKRGSYEKFELEQNNERRSQKQSKYGKTIFGEKNNPMSNPETVQKMRKKLIGRTFLSRGGNGKITPQQEHLFGLLGQGWIMELPILTKEYVGKQKSLPNCYKVDIGNPALKLLIEIDGKSHTTKKWKYLDKRKTEILTSLGWRILRFWNEEVTTNPTSCIQKIQEYMI